MAPDELDPRAGVVGIFTLFGQESLPVPFGLAGRLFGVDAGQGGLDPLGMDELGPLHQGIDHLVLGHHGGVAPLHE